jgi:nitrogen fixation protein NifU and related proteins
MTSDLEALYRDVILDHNRQPRNFRALDHATTAEGYNPVCGDRLTVYVRVERGVIEAAAFQGFGCAIATASASLMTGSVIGKTVVEAAALFERVHHLLASPPDTPFEDLGALSALAGVRKFSVRVKCAMLPWQAMRAAIAASGGVVSTE